MKQILTILFFLLSCSMFAQAPQGFNYQGIARNASGAPFPNQSIQVRLTIRSGQPSGTVEYSEERSVTTNAFGLFTLQIGAPGASNIQGSFASINWAAGTRFLQTEVKVGAQAGFTDLGTTQLMSVPYAINSLQARQLQFPFDTTVNIIGQHVLGIANSSASTFPTINASSVNGPAISATSTNNSGITGYSSKAAAGGVTGANNTNGGYGVYGYTAIANNNSAGVYGFSATGTGVKGSSSSGSGISATSITGTSVQAVSNSGYAVHAQSESGVALRAISQTNTAISASASGNANVLDAYHIGSAPAVFIRNVGTGYALSASAYDNDGILASTSSSAHTAVRARNQNGGYALITEGKVQFAGANMSAGAGKVLTSDASGNATWQAPASTPKIAFKLFGALPHGLNNYSENTWWKVYFDQEEYDFGNTVSVGSTAANSVFTAPIAGVYHFDGAVQLNAPEGAIIAGVAIVKINAAGAHSPVIERNFSETGLLNPDGIGGRPNFAASGDVQLAQGEKVYFRVFWRNGEEEDMGYTGLFPSAFTDAPKKNVFSGHLVFPL